MVEIKKPYVICDDIKELIEIVNSDKYKSLTIYEIKIFGIPSDSTLEKKYNDYYYEIKEGMIELEDWESLVDLESGKWDCGFFFNIIHKRQIEIRRVFDEFARLMIDAGVVNYVSCRSLDDWDEHWVICLDLRKQEPKS